MKPTLFEVLEPELLIEEGDRKKKSWTKFHEDVEAATEKFRKKFEPWRGMRELEHASVLLTRARKKARPSQKERVDAFFADLERQRKF